MATSITRFSIRSIASMRRTPLDFADGERRAALAMALRSGLSARAKKPDVICALESPAIAWTSAFARVFEVAARAKNLYSSNLASEMCSRQFGRQFSRYE